MIRQIVKNGLFIGFVNFNQIKRTWNFIQNVYEQIWTIGNKKSITLHDQAASISCGLHPLLSHS